MEKKKTEFSLKREDGPDKYSPWRISNRFAANNLEIHSCEVAARLTYLSKVGSRIIPSQALSKVSFLGHWPLAAAGEHVVAVCDLATCWTKAIGVND